MNVPDTRDTKQRILDAAERVLTAHGVEGVSLRAVTTDAGVNLAAVNYHFGSKAALLQAMVRRFLDNAYAEQLRLLDALETDTNAPPIAALLTAYATPIFALFDTHREREWGQAWVMLLSAERGSTGVRKMGPTESPEVTHRYREALQRALPDLPSAELRWRFERASSLLMANQGKYLMSAERSESGERPGQHEQAWLLSFLVGALLAPATRNGQGFAP